MLSKMVNTILPPPPVRIVQDHVLDSTDLFMLVIELFHKHFALNAETSFSSLYHCHVTINIILKNRHYDKSGNQYKINDIW